MSINLQMPELRELKPRITVFGVGGAGCNAVNNMIDAGLEGVEFVVANTDAQALTMSKAQRLVQMGVAVTEGLGAGSQPEIGRAAAEETIDEINDYLAGAHMVFITAGMGGGTGTGAAPVVARAAREAGILTVGVVTKPFQFEGQRRMRIADGGIEDLQKHVDTLIVIPNQNLFRIANEKTTFADAFAMADEVLYSGVACITDLMVKDGLINLDFADVRSVMREMGKAMMGTGEASGDKRAVEAAEAAISNPLLDETSMRGAKGLLISVTGGHDMTLFEVDEAASRVREEVDDDAAIIFGATFDGNLDGSIRVSVVATGIDHELDAQQARQTEERMAELTRRLKTVSAPAAPPAPAPARTAEPVAAQAPNRIEREIPRQRPALRQSHPQTAAELAAVRPARRPETPGEIRVEPIKRDPSLVANPHAEADLGAPIDDQHTQPAAFIPPAPQRPDEATPRMPRIEDFPPVAQRQMRGASAAAQDEARRPRGLLARIAQNLSKRDDEEGRPSSSSGHRAAGMEIEPVVSSATQPQAAAPIASPAARPAQAAQPQPAAVQAAPALQPEAHADARPAPATRRPQSEFAKPAQPRRTGEAAAAAGNLDLHGRPRPAPLRDEELEIPAFLRRQSS